MQKEGKLQAGSVSCPFKTRGGHFLRIEGGLPKYLFTYCDERDEAFVGQLVATDPRPRPTLMEDSKSWQKGKAHLLFLRDTQHLTQNSLGKEGAISFHSGIRGRGVLFIPLHLTETPPGPIEGGR